MTASKFVIFSHLSSPYTGFWHFIPQSGPAKVHGKSIIPLYWHNFDQKEQQLGEYPKTIPALHQQHYESPPRTHMIRKEKLKCDNSTAALVRFSMSECWMEVAMGEKDWGGGKVYEVNADESIFSGGEYLADSSLTTQLLHIAAS